MRDLVKRFFGKVQMNAKTGDQKPRHDILVAVCALFVEMARIDETFTAVEMKRSCRYYIKNTAYLKSMLQKSLRKPKVNWNKASIYGNFLT